MSSLLSGVVTYTNRPDDILSPETSRSVIAYLEYLAGLEDYQNLISALALFTAHVEDTNDPHDVAMFDFSNAIMQRIFDFYTTITTAPVWTTLDDFQANIPPDQLLELIRRLVLNAKLYDQLAAGTDPQTVALGPDWAVVDADQTQTTVTSDRDHTTIQSFQKASDPAAITPPDVLMSGDDLTDHGMGFAPTMYASATLNHPMLIAEDSGYKVIPTGASSWRCALVLQLHTNPTRTTTVPVVMLGCTNTETTFVLNSVPGSPGTLQLQLWPYAIGALLDDTATTDKSGAAGDASNIGDPITVGNGVVVITFDAQGDINFYTLVDGVVQQQGVTYSGDMTLAPDAIKLYWPLTIPDGTTDGIISLLLHEGDDESEDLLDTALVT